MGMGFWAEGEIMEVGVDEGRSCSIGRRLVIPSRIDPIHPKPRLHYPFPYTLYPSFNKILITTCPVSHIEPMLRDPCGRPVTNLRISITQECNQRCLYCHREGEMPGGKGNLLTPKELERIAKVAASLGIEKVKFTGGEPLTRHDLPDIIVGVAPHIKDISLTTNGTLLFGLAKKLKAAGLSRVNVSLDSVVPRTYAKITGTKKLEAAIGGIRAARNAGLVPVKLNMVVLRGLNEHEIPPMIHFAVAEGAVLQLIELEAPKGSLSGEWYSKHHADLRDIEAQLGRNAIRTRTRRMHHRRKYFVGEDVLDRISVDTSDFSPGMVNHGMRREASDFSPGSARTVEIEIVRPVHNTEFCAHCNRLRLSSDGRLVPCLFRGERGVDVLGPLRGGASDTQLAGLFREAVSRRETYWSTNEPSAREKGSEPGACP
jgi:cyclic pyranopterin phosphate synthase